MGLQHFMKFKVELKIQKPSRERCTFGMTGCIVGSTIHSWFTSDT